MAEITFSSILPFFQEKALEQRLQIGDFKTFFFNLRAFMQALHFLVLFTPYWPPPGQLLSKTLPTKFLRYMII